MRDTAAPYGFRMQSPFTRAVFMLPATHDATGMLRAGQQPGR
jgi:hypothetical protein